MTEDTDRLFVIAGGPGAGKTTLIEALAARGWRTSPEAARRIIQDQMTIGGRAVHALDPMLAAEIALSWEIRAHREALARPGPVFFDRSLAELVGYGELLGVAVPGHFRRAASLYRYNRKVFLAPFWPQIYVQDAERIQTLEEAERNWATTANAYRAGGYEVVDLPRAGVAERVAFVLAACGLSVP
jgi:predicted ATPase